MTPILCSTSYPCWIPGTGFRAVIDHAQTCYLDDSPMVGKTPILPDEKDHLAALRLNTTTEQTHTATEWHPTAVPLPSAGVLMLAVLTAACMAKFAGPFMRWFEAERGTGPHQNGWV